MATARSIRTSTRPVRGSVLGTYQNPTAIKGYYGKASLPVGKLAVSGEFHQYDFGVSSSPQNEITNVKGNVAVGLGGSSSLELGAEQNKFKTGNIKQNFVNVGYSTMLSEATSFKLGYQLLDYKKPAGRSRCQRQRAHGPVLRQVLSKGFSLTTPPASRRGSFFHAILG